jgi:hypothetical protein
MTALAQIEDEIRQLPTQDFNRLRDWMLAHDAQAWDKQIEEDVHRGVLDDLAQVALQEIKQGKAKRL